MKITCPTCGGKGLIDDLSLIETDLYYSRGNLRGVRQADSPNKGPPNMSCKTCFGQGWITTEIFPDGIFELHLTPDGFWVLLDAVGKFEGHFANDASGFVVILTDTNQGLYPLVSSGFTTLN